MKAMVLLLSTLCIMVTSGLAQDGQVIPIVPEILPAVTTPEWGNDIAITNREPLGKPAGAGRADGTAFIAVPDTGLIANRAVVVYRSSNFGATWAGLAAFAPASVVQKCKMVKTSTDSIYLFFLSGGVLRYWNVETLVARAFDSTGIRDFDVATSAAGGMYLYYDLDRNNQIFRAASADNGVTWPQRALVTSAGAIPRVTMNLQIPGDTLMLNYFGPVKLDTTRSVIRQARYREVASGNLASVTFIDVDTDTTAYRDEFLTVKVRNIAWMLNTRAVPGNTDVMCRVSTNGGVAYGSPFTAMSRPGAYEYWFSAANYSAGVGGLDLVLYADSISAAPNNQTDHLLYGFSSSANPTTFSAPLRISEHYPESSDRQYSPTLFEYHDPNGDAGAVWVGYDAGVMKVYYDHLYAPSVGVTPAGPGIPEVYSLGQNYPNPFNPATQIEFALPKSGFVSLKVYDLLGREVQTLVAEDLTAGLHKVRLNASGLASGVYLYRLSTGNYVETKKLTVLK